jgi:formylglycine-generating enzyme required for sulfatase activity
VQSKIRARPPSLKDENTRPPGVRALFPEARTGASALLRAGRVSLCLSLAALALPASGAGVADEAYPVLLEIPAGPFIVGSDAAEREFAYQLDEGAYGHSITREQRWYAGETDRATIALPAFHITRTPITNGEYAAFVADTHHRAPDVDAATWAGYGLVHPFARTRRHAWRHGRPPAGREAHPVVLVSRDDALAYAGWLSRRSGQRWRLPREEEWEKAARGRDGRIFPWGDAYDAGRLNSHDNGPFDTLPVGTFSNGVSPFGILDGAGQVFEWTGTPAGSDHAIVKGGSWDDKGCGVCRPAARHGRPLSLKHILIGFRLVRE